MITVTNIEELKDFILNNALSREDIAKLISSTIGVLADVSKDKKDIIADIERYWKQYNHVPPADRPFFTEEFTIQKAGDFFPGFAFNYTSKV